MGQGSGLSANVPYLKLSLSGLGVLALEAFFHQEKSYQRADKRGTMRLQIAALELHLPTVFPGRVFSVCSLQPPSHSQSLAS